MTSLPVGFHDTKNVDFYSMDLPLMSSHLTGSAIEAGIVIARAAEVNDTEASVLKGCGDRAVLSGAVTMATVLANEWLENDANAKLIYEAVRKNGAWGVFGIGSYSADDIASAGIPIPDPLTSYVGFDDGEMAAINDGLAADLGSAGADPNALEGEDTSVYLGAIGDVWQEALDTLNDPNATDAEIAAAEAITTAIWLGSKADNAPLTPAEVAIADAVVANWDELIAVADEQYHPFTYASDFGTLTVQDLEFIAANGPPHLAKIASDLLASPNLLSVVDTAAQDPLDESAKGDGAYSLGDFTVGTSSIYAFLGPITDQVDIAAQGGDLDGTLSKEDYEHILATADLPGPVRTVIQFIIDNKLYDEPPSTWGTVADVAGWVGVGLFLVATAGSGGALAPGTVAALNWLAVGAAGVELGAGLAAGDEWSVVGGFLGLLPVITGPNGLLLAKSLGIGGDTVGTLRAVENVTNLVGEVSYNQAWVLLNKAGLNADELLKVVDGGAVSAEFLQTTVLLAKGVEPAMVKILVGSAAADAEYFDQIVAVVGALGPALTVGSAIGGVASPPDPPPPVPTPPVAPPPIATAPDGIPVIGEASEPDLG